MPLRGKVGGCSGMTAELSVVDVDLTVLKVSKLTYVQLSSYPSASVGRARMLHDPRRLEQEERHMRNERPQLDA